MLLGSGDVERLARALGMEERGFARDFTRLAPNRGQLALAERPDGSCILLRDDLCRCYDARPDQCRRFPLGWRDPSGCPAAACSPPP